MDIVSKFIFVFCLPMFILFFSLGSKCHNRRIVFLFDCWIREINLMNWNNFINRPRTWNVQDIVARTKLLLDGMSHFFLCPAPQCSRDEKEWGRFLTFLQIRDMVKCYCFIFIMCIEHRTFINFLCTFLLFID